MEKTEKQTIAGKNKIKNSAIAVLALVLFLFLISGSSELTSSISAGKKLFASSFLTINKEKAKSFFNYAPILTAKENTAPLPNSPLSYLSAYIDENGKITILAEKNSDDLLPMASLTKLMTAIVAYKNYNLNETIAIDAKANDWQNSSKRFIPGTSFKISEMLRALLIESNNDSAMTLAEKVGMENFMVKMNNEARRLGMITTYYDNPVGLDPASKKENINYSTAKELLVLMKEIIKNYPQLLETTSLSQFDIKTADGGYNHTAINTNKFISDENEKLFCRGEQLKIVGGKTGSTDLAKKNLILAMKSPNEHGYLITIILSSNDNFLETKKLVNWICESYSWPKPSDNVLNGG